MNTKSIIKIVNKAFKGRINGASKTTSSIYSNFTHDYTDYRVRVSKHMAVCKRSMAYFDAVIYATPRVKGFFYVEMGNFTSNDLNTEFEVANFIINTIQSELA